MPTATAPRPWLHPGQPHEGGGQLIRAFAHHAKAPGFQEPFVERLIGTRQVWQAPLALISGARRTGARLCRGFSLPQCVRQSPRPPEWCWPCRPGRAAWAALDGFFDGADHGVVRRAACALAWVRKSSISAPTRSWQSGWRCSCRRCQAEMHRLEQAGEAAPGFRLAEGRDHGAGGGGAQVTRMSPNRLVAATTSKRPGCSTKRAVRMSMCCLSSVILVVLGDSVGALVPPGHADGDAVVLVARVTCFWGGFGPDQKRT